LGSEKKKRRIESISSSAPGISILPVLSAAAAAAAATAARPLAAVAIIGFRAPIAGRVQSLGSAHRYCGGGGGDRKMGG
jgi:hypothetical protein